MSNLFGIDYEKPGRGVPEDGSRENGFIRFFKIVQRKFWAMVRLNFLQVLFSLPAFATSAFLFSHMAVRFMPDNAGLDLSLRIFFGFILVVLQVVTTGPIQAGFIYVLRNYSREEHAFVWSDFIKGIKENWKRALAVSVIDMLVVFIVLYTYMFYNTNTDRVGVIGEASRAIIIIIAVVYAMMHMYIYPMMVTLDLTVKQIYSNSVKFAFGKLLPNLGILLLMLVISTLMFLNTVVGIGLMLIIGYSLLNFLSTFYAYYGIEKYIIKKIEESQPTTDCKKTKCKA